MTALADVEDVEAVLGRTLTSAESDRMELLLAAASARFRAEAGGREFTAGESTLRLRVTDGRVTLPQRPVTAVTSVHTVAADDATGPAVGTWAWDGLSTLTVGDWAGLQINAPELDDPVSVVEVVYTHGYAEVPDDVRWAVASMAARVLSTAASGTGIESETIGGYSYRLGSAAGSGALGMTPDEQRIARRYRRTGLSTVALR